VALRWARSGRGVKVIQRRGSELGRTKKGKLVRGTPSLEIVDVRTGQGLESQQERSLAGEVNTKSIGH
jgi:hypothetical protein